MKKSILFIGSLLVFFLTACTPRSHVAVLTKGSSSLSAWPIYYQQNFNRLHSFFGKARLTIESPQASGHVSIQTYWICPDTLFIQAEGPLGIDVGKIFIGKNRFLVYNQFANQYISGSLDDPFLSRFLQTSFTFRELKPAFLGRPPIDPEKLQLIEPRHGIFVQYIGGQKYRYVVNPATGLLERWEVIQNGELFLKEEFRNYREFDGIALPTLISITLPERQERLSIFYEEIQVNIPIDPEIYRITLSPKVKQLNIN